MSAIHAAVGQPPSVQSVVTFSTIALAVVRAFAESHSIESSARMTVEYSHAPSAAGNNGGAVSGAGSCALVVETQKHHRQRHGCQLFAIAK